MGNPVSGEDAAPCMVLVGDALCPERMEGGRCRVHGAPLVDLPDEQFGRERQTP